MEEFRKLTTGLLLCTDVMARGIDVPDVHWVVQYDPPKSAESFVHRCGRTARIGNTGNALVLLLPTEDTYINFIEINQKVVLKQFVKKPEVHNYLPKLQKMAIKDRAMYEKGARAFVSFVQSYLKHECNMIFRIKALDFGRLATGYGLVTIPKMPELKGKPLDNFEPVDIDVSSIPYRYGFKPCDFQFCPFLCLSISYIFYGTMYDWQGFNDIYALIFIVVLCTDVCKDNTYKYDSFWT